MRKLEHELKEKGCTTKIELRIPIEQEFEILDLLAIHSVWRFLAIVSDVFNLDMEHDKKVSKYDIQDVHKWMLRMP